MVALLFYECRLSSEETERWWGHSNPTFCNQICLNLLHSQIVGRLKHLPTPACALLAPESPGEIFTV